MFRMLCNLLTWIIGIEDEPYHGREVRVTWYRGYEIVVTLDASSPGLPTYTAIARNMMPDTLPMDLGGVPSTLTGVGYSPGQAMGDAKMAINEVLPRVAEH